jgi:hypothetical protein
MASMAIAHSPYAFSITHPICLDSLVPAAEHLVSFHGNSHHKLKGAILDGLYQMNAARET